MEYIVEMNHISKRFGGVAALSEANLKLRKGEFHALMGENGAGKSTLMRILAGAITKDSGELIVNGEKVELKNAKDSIQHGISMIYQELMLIPDLTVAENIFIDQLASQSKILDWKRLRREAQAMLDELGFSNIRATDEVRNLTVACQQVVEICKALSRKSNVLILDEPTSVLSNNEVVCLFKMLRLLREQGCSIIYISHRIEEVFELCDRITVMRDGCYIDTVNVSEIDKNTLVNMMVGRPMSNFYPQREAQIGETMLRVEHIRAGRMVKDVSFEVRAGEVLGINGLVGAGRTETLRAIIGEDKKDGGKIFVNGVEKRIRTPKEAVKAGIGYLSEDRKGQGVLLDLSVRHNLTLCSLKQFQTFLGKISRVKENKVIQSVVEMLHIKISTPEQAVSSLSGGNQQKVAIGKLLQSGCHILLLDEPTRGVDVGAKYEVYNIINSFAEKGYAVVMVSSEMPEIIGVCDRVVVMRNGEVTAELQKEDITEQNLIHYSMGV